VPNYSKNNELLPKKASCFFYKQSLKQMAHNCSIYNFCVSNLMFAFRYTENFILHEKREFNKTWFFTNDKTSRHLFLVPCTYRTYVYGHMCVCVCVCAYTKWCFVLQSWHLLRLCTFIIDRGISDYRECKEWC